MIRIQKQLKMLVVDGLDNLKHFIKAKPEYGTISYR